jgi:hypothetical protein
MGLHDCIVSPQTLVVRNKFSVADVRSFNPDRAARNASRGLRLGNTKFFGVAVVVLSLSRLQVIVIKPASYFRRRLVLLGRLAFQSVNPAHRASFNGNDF